MASHLNWRSAYARQALVDLEAREVLLESPNLPRCQELHFLQMACEKVSKAYLLSKPGADLKSLRSSHVCIAKTLPLIAQVQFTKNKSHTDRSWVLRAIEGLSRKIELLSPAVNDGGKQPANCEYPWEAPNGTIRIPCQHNFNLDILHDPAGPHLLKVVYTAAKELAA